MTLGPERRVVVAAAGLAALSLLLFGMEWRTLAALEAKTAYAVRQDLRQAGDAVVRGMYRYLEAEARLLEELDHQSLDHGTSEDLAPPWSAPGFAPAPHPPSSRWSPASAATNARPSSFDAAARPPLFRRRETRSSVRHRGAPIRSPSRAAAT